MLNRFYERGHPVFVLEGDGEIPRTTVERMLARKLLVENADAMFGTNYSYRVNETALGCR